MFRPKLIYAAVFAMFIASAPAFADILFTDSTFNPANYTQVGPFMSLATITGSQCAACGDPGFGLQFHETFSDTTVNDGTAALAFVNDTFSYNPSTQGPIVSIDASVDKNATVNGLTASFGNTFRPLIEQDGNYYLAAIAGANFNTPGTTGYLTLSKSGLGATDFLKFDFTTGTFGTASPNFSGDTMLFGIAQISTIGGYAAGPTLEQEYDNLSLNLSPVPEPSSVLLLITLLLLVRLTFSLQRPSLK